MKEIIVTEPSECPFLYDGYCAIPDSISKKVIICNDDNNFPSDCPLFENDCLIKRKRR